MTPLLAGKRPEIEQVPEGATEEERLAALIDAISSYVEHYHGGSVTFVDLSGDTVRVRLGGACIGCPLTPATLCNWVLGTVHQFFPQVQHVKAVETQGEA